MSVNFGPAPSPSTVRGRTAQILDERSKAGHRTVDRMFAILITVEWLASIVLAVIFSPIAWAGEARGAHPHVWAALVLGGLAASLPVALALMRPGRSSTRHSVAIGQMLIVALLIHLSGGRLEWHFHVFCSLAFLALYRDWRVLIAASAVVAADHYLRGVYWPRSVFGAVDVPPWRWLEHSAWVAFEDVVLILGMTQSLALMRESSRRQAQVEATRDRVEAAVLERTAELRKSQAELEDRVRSRTEDLRELNGSLLVEVAERRKVEVDLRASEERFRTVTESLPQIVWEACEDGRANYLNARWYEYTGLPRGESIGDNWIDFIHPEDRAGMLAAWEAALATGSLYEAECRIRRGEDGSYRWHLGRGLPIRKPDGTILRWFGSSTDIDDQRRAAEALRRSHLELEDRVRERTAALERANDDLIVEVAERRKAEVEAHQSREAAEQATQAKSQFLANMSHEIRTPMNAIIGMTEITLGLRLEDEPRENLEVVRDAADSLLQLIDDILDFSKIEAGKLDLEPIRFRPRETVKAASKTLELRASEKGLTLACEVATDVPEFVVGDPHRLRQVLLNLIGNAIKFTAQGRVDVLVGISGADDDGFVLGFSVRDEGIGIESSRLGMIFDPFSQADGSMTRRFGGTGLGLSISTRLVELMGGKIWAESQVGRGSSFHFTARFGKLAEPPPPPAAALGAPVRRKSTTSFRILLVDDNELNRRVGLSLLERLGHVVRLAEDGPIAIARYEQEGPFDLVLMDVQMPGMDGIEATALIRGVQGRQGRRCPIVALTAFAMKVDRDRCLAGGMDEHLAKPIRSEELEWLIARLLEAEATVVGGDEARWALDPSEVRESLPIGDEEMTEVVALFRETCREQLASMARAISQGDPAGLARSAHSLTGCLGLFATEATVALADRLEEAGRSGDLADARATLAGLERAYAGMQPTLDRLAEVHEGDGGCLVTDRASTATA